MSTSTREGLSPIEVLELEYSLDEEMPCEHWQHKSKVSTHEGFGTWYVQFVCPSGCKRDTIHGMVLLVCEKFKKRMCEEVGATCYMCGVKFDPGEGFVVVERK